MFMSFVDRTFRYCGLYQCILFLLQLLLGTGHGKVRFFDTENKKTICDVTTDSQHQYPR